jgi:MFS family permease
VLLAGWSLLEGVGAALILPAIVALVAANFGPEGRPRAYGLVMAAGAVAVAVGPLIGGLFTTYLSWRLVFAGEVLIVLGILVLTRRIADEPPGKRPRIDLVGVVLSAAGLGLAVQRSRLPSSAAWRRALGRRSSQRTCRPRSSATGLSSRDCASPGGVPASTCATARSA